MGQGMGEWKRCGILDQTAAPPCETRSKFQHLSRIVFSLVKWIEILILRVVVIIVRQKSWMKLKVGTNSCCGYPVWGEAWVQPGDSCHRVATFPDLSPWKKATLAVVKDSPIFPPKRQKRKDLPCWFRKQLPTSLLSLSPSLSLSCSLSLLPPSISFLKQIQNWLNHPPTTQHYVQYFFSLYPPDQGQPTFHANQGKPRSLVVPFRQASCCHQRGCWNLIVRPPCADPVPLVFREGTLAFNSKFSEGCLP